MNINIDIIHKSY